MTIYASMLVRILARFPLVAGGKFHLHAPESNGTIGIGNITLSKCLQFDGLDDGADHGAVESKHRDRYAGVQAYNIPKLIMIEIEIFCPSLIFRFQSKDIGNRARSRSAIVHTASSGQSSLQTVIRNATYCSAQNRRILPLVVANNARLIGPRRRSRAGIVRMR